MSMEFESSRRDLIGIFSRYDSPFPLLEIFMAIVIAATILAVSTLGSTSAGKQVVVAIETVAVSVYFPLLLFGLLGIRNVSSGVGGWLESGDWRLYLQFPASRVRIIFTRLASAVGLPLVVALTGFILGIAATDPSLVLSEYTLLLVGFTASLLPVLFIVAATVPIALSFRSTSISFFAGIGLLVGYETVSQIVTATFAGTRIAGTPLSFLAPIQYLLAQFELNCTSCLNSFELTLVIWVFAFGIMLVASVMLFRNRTEV
jgi:hypothetical protein